MENMFCTLDNILAPRSTNVHKLGSKQFLATMGLLDPINNR